jgi:hypothetical protein
MTTARHMLMWTRSRGLLGAAHCLLGHEASSVDVEGGAAALMAAAATHALVLLRATTHEPGPAKGLWLVRALETVPLTPAPHIAPYALCVERRQ